MTHSGLPTGDWYSLLLGIQNFEFALGMALAIIYRRYDRIRELSIPVPVGWLLIITAGVIVLGVRQIEPTIASELVAAGAVALAIPLASSRSICARFWEMLGNASYSIYLTHSLFIEIGAAIWLKYVGSSQYIISCVAIAIVSVAGGIVLHFVVEKPLIRTCNHFLQPSARAPATSGERPTTPV